MKLFGLAVGTVIGFLTAIAIYALGAGCELLNCACNIVSCNLNGESALPMWEKGVFFHTLLICTFIGAFVGFVYGVLYDKQVADAEAARIAEEEEAARIAAQEEAERKAAEREAEAERRAAEREAEAERRAAEREAERRALEAQRRAEREAREKRMRIAQEVQKSANIAFDKCSEAEKSLYVPPRIKLQAPSLRSDIQWALESLVETMGILDSIASDLSEEGAHK